jgi:ATP-dependent RNA helicase RhlE
VVNYNIPSDPEGYVHRIGRTARAGKDGLAISMCSEQEKENLENIEKLIGKKLTVMQDDSYKKEEISKSEFLGSFRFDDEENKSSRNRK